MKYKNSLFFMGMTISYGILFGVQLVGKGLLPVSVYYFVAWATFQLSILELAKTTALYADRFYRMSRRLKMVYEIKITKDIRFDKVVTKILNVMTFLQYIIILVMAVLTPLKDIPNNFATNKIICCLTLLSFSLNFLNLFFNHYGSERYAELRKKELILRKLRLES